jgi:hypothetical protein
LLITVCKVNYSIYFQRNCYLLVGIVSDFLMRESVKRARRGEAGQVEVRKVEAVEKGRSRQGASKKARRVEAGEADAKRRSR